MDSTKEKTQENPSSDLVTDKLTMTTLISNTTPVAARPSNTVAMDSGLMQGMSDGDTHSIKEFLARPVIVRNGDWLSTMATSTGLTNVQIPLDIIQASKTISQKISGFYGFRAKAVIRLQVNCNRFQQGRLCMYFFPQQDVSKRKYNNVNGSVFYWTQLPRIDFDAATDTEVVLEVPYVSPYLALDTTTGQGTVGIVNVVVYSPLVAASGELSAEYTVWAHFEDVELLFPTVSNNAVVPQAGGTRRMRVGASVEDESPTEGPISSQLIKISKATNILGEIPLLSSIATPASWLSNVLARSASAMGFSVPLNLEHAAQYQQRTFSKAINVSGSDNSINMALAEDNHLELLPSFASSGVDEMSFHYSLSIPTFIATITWVDTATPLNTLYGLGTGPNSFRFPNAQGFDTTPTSYLANLFRYWKGSFKFKLKFVKTEFHSGRLLIAFVPGYTTLPVPSLTTANAAYLHKDVIDIRSLTEYEFVVPWVANRPMLECQTSSGGLYISVLNELRHPDTVNNSIQIIVEQSCCDDFQFAVPNNALLIPYTSAPSTYPQGGEALIGQMDKSSQPGTLAQDGLGTSSIQQINNLSSARFAVGEFISSYRQLIKRAVPIIRATISGSDQNVAYAAPSSIILPTYFTDTSTVNTNLGLTLVDYVSIITACFAFYRGSTRIRAYNPGSGTYVARAVYGVDQAITAGGYAPYINPMWSKLRMTPVVPTPSSVYPNPELSIPWYGKFSHAPVLLELPANPPNTTYANLGIAGFAGTEAASTDLFLTRQAGDDFSCGFWTGSLPLLSTANYSQTTPFF
jgi:hypothetical protein